MVISVLLSDTGRVKARQTSTMTYDIILARPHGDRETMQVSFIQVPSNPTPHDGCTPQSAPVPSASAARKADETTHVLYAY